ncbi:MAG: biotin--[acetyl-CoA-carboxylase] ligase [Elusimicrobiota bacterium]
MTPALPGVRVLLHLKSASSTQSIARKLAEEGAEHRTLVWADRQTRGRGRMERRWSSPKGGLYFSLISRPKVAPARLAGLSRLFAKACSRAIARCTGLKTCIKPPNDVLASPGTGLRYRKVCGILLEAAGDSKSVHWLAAGIGINVNNRIPSSLPHAASLQDLAGRRFSVEEVLRRVLAELETMRL